MAGGGIGLDVSHGDELLAIDADHVRGRAPRPIASVHVVLGLLPIEQMHRNADAEKWGALRGPLLILDRLRARIRPEPELVPRYGGQRFISELELADVGGLDGEVRRSRWRGEGNWANRAGKH
jgi:hypothetical protein